MRTFFFGISQVAEQKVLRLVMPLQVNMDTLDHLTLHQAFGFMLLTLILTRA
jgi:hypothetical protein